MSQAGESIVASQPRAEEVWFGPRLVALIVDWVIFGVLWMVVSVWLMSSMTLPAMPAAQDPNQFPAFPVEIFRTMVTAMVVLNIGVFLYFVIMETWRGATIGKGIVGIRTIDRADPDRIGLPFGKALLRELGKIAGLLPSLVFMFFFVRIMFSAFETGTPEQIAKTLESSGAFTWMLPVQMIAQFLPLAWMIWIAVSLSGNRAPMYDRWAGTTVVRTK